MYLLQHLLEQTTRRTPDKVALVCQNGTHRYADIDAQSNALASALRHLGVARGDRVAIFGDNSVECVVAIWGVLKADAVFVIINPLTKRDKLAYILNDCRATALITDGALSGTFVDAARASTHLRAVIVAGNHGAVPMTSLPRAIPFRTAVEEGHTIRPRTRNIGNDLAAIIYTSGSTGDPKGVMLTHANMLFASWSIATYLELRDDDVVINVLPMAFDYGLYQMLLMVRVGGQLVLGRSFAYPTQLLNLLVEHRVTGFPLVPTMSAMLAELKNLHDFDLRSVRFVTNTAAALPVAHIERLREIFADAKLFSMYGLTECKRCSYLPPSEIATRPTSVGIAIPGTELWVVDEEGREVPPETVGQLVIRGPHVMKGYWEKPEQTAHRLRPGPLPNEMVLHSGDFCRKDKDGFLYFVSRMDDIIKSRGEKVAPKEVENAIYSIEGVKECAVIGIADPILGQAVKACVVMQADSDRRYTERDVIKACQAKLEAFMVPKHVVFVHELPKTTTGKIKKTDLQ